MSNYGDTPDQGSTSPYGQQPASPVPPSNSMPPAKGFIGALFDVSFSTFVTPMIIKVVYILGMVVIGFATLFFAFSGFFGDSPGVGIVTLIVGPIVGVLYLAFFRMFCEFYLAIIRMSEDVHRRLPPA